MVIGFSAVEWVNDGDIDIANALLIETGQRKFMAASDPGLEVELPAMTS